MIEPTPAPWAARYVRKKRLGDGGQGTTLLVQSIATGEQFALKELHEKQQRDPGRRNRMRIEAATLEVLDHPCVPRVVEHNGEQFRDLDMPLFLVMELAQGGTLKQRIEKDGPLGIDAALAVATCLLDALAYCHGQEVVHRDVKPDNIAFRGDHCGEPVLLDFGLTFNWRYVDANATRSGEQLGNRFLHLPELLAGADRRDPRSDVTQCAGVLLYTLTGIQPVSLVDARGYAPHQRPEQHELLADRVPPSILRFFDQAFHPRLGDRFQTAESARMALANLGLTSERMSRAAAIAKRLRDRVFDDDLYIGETAAREVIEQVRKTLNDGVKAAHAELATPGTATRTADFREADGHLAWTVTVGLVLDAGVRVNHLSMFLLRIAAREVFLTPDGANGPLLRAPVAGFACTPEAVAAVSDVVLSGFELDFERAATAREAAPVVTPELKRGVIDIIVGEHLQTCANVNGADILLRLGASSRELGDRAIDACVPLWLRPGTPRPADDYRPTLAGLLASAHGGRAREFIRRVIAHWKEVAPRDGTAARIRADQAEFAEFENPFKSAVMATARLGGGGQGGGRDHPFDFGVPHRFMDILQCSTADDVVALWDRVG